MMSIYDNNYKAVKEGYPDIAAYLDDSGSDESVFGEEHIEAGVQDVCGKTVMCVHKGGHTFQLDSLYDSDKLLDIWIRTYGDDWFFGSKLFMYGFGNGMYVRKFLKSTGNGCSIVVHEPSLKIFKTTMANFDISDLISDPRVTVVLWPVHKKTDEIKTYYDRIISYRDDEWHKIGFYANYPRVFEDDCRNYLAGLKSTMEAKKADRIVHDRFGRDYNRNTFNNLKYIPRSFSYKDLIRLMPQDIPAVIVAAGPSLDKNINDLKDAKGKCILIATDTALKPLALAGIDPDIAVITDGKKDAKYLSEYSSRQVPLFCTPRSGGEFMNLHEGKKFFTDYYCKHIKHFMDEEGCFFIPLPTGGSVANSCFGLAESLHCRRIILVGQDLAYTGDKTHSETTVRGEAVTAVEDLEHVIMDVDINGEPIRSSQEFKLYKEWFEDEIKSHPDLRVIDATEGGIRIEGTVLMTLSEAVETECNREFDFEGVLSGVARLFDKEKEQRFSDYIRKIPDQIEELKHIICNAISCYRDMERLVQTDNYRDPHMRVLYKRAQDLGRRIENNVITEYVHNQLQGGSGELLDRFDQPEIFEKRELLSICELGVKHFRDMVIATDELEPYVETIRRDFGI